MYRNILLIITFLSLNSSCSFLYHDELDLCLFKDGVSNFVDMGKHTNDFHYQDAIYSVIKLASSNGRDAAYLLEKINNHLNYRINRIKNLKNKSIEREVIMQGLGLIGCGIMSGCVTYYFYKNYYCANN